MNHRLHWTSTSTCSENIDRSFAHSLLSLSAIPGQVDKTLFFFFFFSPRATNIPNYSYQVARYIYV